jgi:hypothetical protein
VLGATVENAALRQSLGRNALNITFDLGGWVPVSAVGPGTEVMVSCDCGGPLMIMNANSSGGRVAYTSFHNEAQLPRDVEKILRALIFQL